MRTQKFLRVFDPIQNAQRRAFRREALTGLSPDDREKFEIFGQGRLVPLPYDNIHAAFEDQVARQPNATAVASNGETDRGQTITYGELNRLANALARELVELGVRPGDSVGVFLQRSIDMIVGILAALKAGANYVPQDARITPLDQLRHIAGACEMKVILTQSRFLRANDSTDLRGLADGKTSLLAIDELRADDDGRSAPLVLDRGLHVAGDDVCFVLFTSGTTGRPNGVQVTHKNVCNILLTQPGDLGMRPGLKVSQILNISFDMAAWEILGALSHGSTLVIRGSEIEETIRQVDVVIATPSILGSVDVANCRNVRAVAVAGEPCPKPLAEAWAEFSRFYNCCGPTEVTIVNTMKEFSANSRSLTIGAPTPNNTVYILDENLNPLPFGEVGEMWAGGDCVSAGYLKNAALTDERYKPDPFLGRGRMMFRTRDLGRWTQNGELEHLGRTDDQVKIRGFRVELDSVSNALESADGCLQAVTLKMDSRTLAAFVRPANVDLAKAREQVEKNLPYYCVPEILIALDEFPMTSRGKIDKRTLLLAAAKERGSRS